MRHVDVPQGSAAWLEARHGKITGSRIVDVLDQLKRGGEGANRRNYRIELIAERLSGRSEDHYVSPEMQWGTDTEPFARAAYEIEKDVMVDQVGFIMHPVFDFAGASPDGLIGKDGGVEFKCPKVSTHIRWMLEGVVPEEHQPQCLFNMRCTERKWWDFVSYQPLLPDGLKMFTVRMHRDDDRMEYIDQEVKRFNTEVESIVSDLRSKVKPSPITNGNNRSAFDELMAMIDEEIIP